jgi:hypothetical protein
MDADDRAAQLAQLMGEISRLEDELRVLDLRDIRALDEHRRKIQRLQVEVARYRKQQDTAECRSASTTSPGERGWRREA